MSSASLWPSAGAGPSAVIWLFTVSICAALALCAARNFARQVTIRARISSSAVFEARSSASTFSASLASFSQVA